MRGRAGPGRLRHRVGATIRDRGLWTAGERVAVAVSGGADSVALLDLLVETRRWHGARLEVVTVDHGTRADADTDASFVWALARDRGLPVTRFDLGLGAHASEAVCREARYAAFERLGADRIALAHHREDLVETVLLQLIRGTAAHGIAWVRGPYVRPLLDVPRDDLRRWLAWRSLAWREDPTNEERIRLRNRLRHEVLPLLEDLRPGAIGAFARSVLAAADERPPRSGS
ncbi:MAG: tRNA lysidine(34) synthetase TilS [Myxococcales bacterium]|nr:tRNA lysidine(34) synthetase TilS [Myxococcales bacterium]